MSHFSTLVIINAEDAEDNMEQALWTMEEMLEPYKDTRFNPTAKWDYWLLGGRWAGELLCKDGAIEKELAKLEKEGWVNEGVTFAPNQVDICRFDMLDLEAMRQKVRDERRALWERTQATFAKAGDQAFSEQELDQLRVQLLRKDDELYKRYIQEKPKENYHLWREEFLTSSEESHLDLLHYLDGSQSYEDIENWTNDVCGFNTYAFVDSNNYWQGKGRMGWFGISTDEMLHKDWETTLKERVQQIQPNDWVAIVDCHI